MWTTCYVHMSNKKNCGGELQGGGSYDPPLGSSRHKKRLVVGRLMGIDIFSHGCLFTNLATYLCFVYPYRIYQL